jgi:hypothetical protein
MGVVCGKQSIVKKKDKDPQIKTVDDNNTLVKEKQIIHMKIKVLQIKKTNHQMIKRKNKKMIRKCLYQLILML